ncbi:MAG: alpha/beta fold hydrolase [Actinobacteria bacterium]|nr:alpha/beta fold hydrolase [Actinomycetota bacterium]
MSSPQAVKSWFQKYVNAPRYKSRESMRFTTADGVKLHAVRLAGPGDCGATVVLAHGFANWHRHPKIHEFANQLAEHVNVIVLDMRGHGFSEGTSTLGALEYLDVAAAAQQVPSSDALILIGTSMGSAASVIYAGRAAHGDGGRRADAVVAISGPAWWGGRDAARGVGRVLELAASPFMRASMKYLMRVRIQGMRQDGRVDPVTVVGEIAPAPVVIIHDKADWYFGVDQVEAMKSAAGPTGQLWWRDGGHATDLFSAELCEQIVNEIINPVIRSRRTPGKLQNYSGGVVEVANAEVRVEGDPPVVVDG